MDKKWSQSRGKDVDVMDMVQQFIAGYAIFLVIARSTSTCVKSEATYWSVTSTNIVGSRSEVIFKKSSNHYAQLDLGVCYP